ncbi:hypothetical protein K4F52_000442 [Lecanicillium sp. MT-2017a]|nr:hypothetical protein K4F52_000442 [Lecanicillium sp. MT-2017a]
MSPAIIADSDDESDDQDLSTVPITRRGDILQLAGQQTGYSDSMVSLPTSSTDPAHFQSVYKEQIAAAQQQHAQGTRGAFVTPQDATQQTWEATDPVSLPSQYVNMHTVVSRAHGLSESVQAGNGADGTQQGENPWEVPSSPEKRTSDSTSRRAAKNDAKSSKSGQPLAADASNGNGARAYDSGDVDAQRAKKRRRVDQQDENADFVQRQAMDQELQNGTAEGLGDSSLPPTMPMQNDPSLVITTQPLSASQKMQYQSVEVAPGNSDEVYNSSQKSPTKEVDTPERKKTTKRKSPQRPAKKRQPRKKRTELSEEIIVLEDHVDEDAHGVNEIDDGGIPDAQKRGLPGSDDEAYADDIVALGTQVETEETATTPAKPKKRGRPKKTKNEKYAASQPTETTKKKRGRPRKQKAEEVDSAQQSPGSHKADAEEAKDEQQNSPAPEVRPEEQQDVQPDMQPEMTDAVVEEDSKELRTETPDDSKSVSASAEVAKAGSNAVSRKQGGGSKASPSSDGKPPVYRVGLSRRSRIAPLLKIVRK